MGENLILCQITSQKITKDSFSIPLSQKDTINGTLNVDSYVRANMIFTATTSQIQRKVC